MHSSRQQSRAPNPGNPVPMPSDRWVPPAPPSLRRRVFAIRTHQKTVKVGSNCLVTPPVDLNGMGQPARDLGPVVARIGHANVPATAEVTDHTTQTITPKASAGQSMSATFSCPSHQQCPAHHPTPWSTRPDPPETRPPYDPDYLHASRTPTDPKQPGTSSRSNPTSSPVWTSTRPPPALAHQTGKKSEYPAYLTERTPYGLTFPIAQRGFNRRRFEHTATAWIGQAESFPQGRG